MHACTVSASYDQIFIQVKMVISIVFLPAVIDTSSCYLISLNAFFYLETCYPYLPSAIHLWISLCSSISKRVAFSRVICRAIYRILPEHQAWCCCCCCLDLSPLLTTPAVSVYLNLSLFSLLFLQLCSLSELPFTWWLPLTVFPAVFFT